MNRLHRTFFGFFFLSLGALLPAANAATCVDNLCVYSIDITNVNYLNTSPYLFWPGSKILNNTTSWIYAEQFLRINTDQNYHSARPWAVQVFTDNRQQYNSTATYHIPDWIDGNGV